MFKFAWKRLKWTKKGLCSKTTVLGRRLRRRLEILDHLWIDEKNQQNFDQTWVRTCNIRVRDWSIPDTRGSLLRSVRSPRRAAVQRNGAGYWREEERLDWQLKVVELFEMEWPRQGPFKAGVSKVETEGGPWPMLQVQILQKSSKIEARRQC